MLLSMLCPDSEGELFAHKIPAKRKVSVVDTTLTLLQIHMSFQSPEQSLDLILLMPFAMVSTKYISFHLVLPLGHWPEHFSTI